MNPLLFLLLTFFAPPADSSIIEWQTPTTHDFGDIPFKLDTTHAFIFKNLSTDTLYIDNVRPSCGCTNTKWDTQPVLPDSSGQINVVFDANNEGYFLKKIKVYFSVQREPEFLWIEGDVIKNE